MELYLNLLANLFWLNILLAILVVFFGRKDPQSTAFWIMVLAFIPVIGFFLYLLLGQNFHKRKMFTLKKEEDRFVKDYVDIQGRVLTRGRFRFSNWRSQRYESLIKQNLRSDEAFLSQNNHIDLFFWGEDLYEQMIVDLKQARNMIDMQYYIFKSDELGRRLLAVLTQKAEEGVQVRLLYDGIGGRTLSASDLAPLQAAGGRTAVFFPSILPYVNFRINYRNHRKLVIIDDSIGYIGGFNVGDEYLGKSRRFGEWRDTHLRIRGDAAFGMKIRFLKDWYYASNDKKEEEEADPLWAPYEHEGDTGVQIVTSGPDTELPNVKSAIFRMIANAKERVYIQTPYFIPDQAILEALVTALSSGVDVHIMIPRKRDHPFVHWASLSFLGELLPRGAKCYIYEKGFLHAKMVAVDDYVSTVGSTNMDNRSFHLNFEANAIIYDQEINEKLINQFLVDTFYSDELRLSEYKARGITVKIREAFSRLLAPLL